MRLLATIKEDDIKKGQLIEFWAEDVEAVDLPRMWLGYMVQDGEDDRIFAFERTLEDIQAQVNRRWGNFMTYRTVKDDQ